MQIATTRFGTVEITPEQRVTLPEGLLGFETIHDYCLLPHAPDSPFLWLQAVEEPSLAFVVINPFDLFSDYDIEISEADALSVQLADTGDAAVLAIVTFADQQVTANLAGPILCNRAERLAKQIVLADPRYGTRHALVPANAAD